MAKEQATKRGNQFKDIAGQAFGRLRAIKPVGKDRHSKVQWECLCDPSLGGCGETVIASGCNLRKGNSSSCGCSRVESMLRVHTTHGMKHTAEYRSWQAMKDRCSNQNTISFPNYGGRGISVCERWLHSFENFFADMGKRPSAKHSIERVNNNGNYEPGNCMWATKTAQARNTRRTHRLTFNGQTKSLTEWAQEIGITRAALRNRLKKGWSVERALS